MNTRQIYVILLLEGHSQYHNRSENLNNHTLVLCVLNQEMNLEHQSSVKMIGR